MSVSFRRAKFTAWRPRLLGLGLALFGTSCQMFQQAALNSMSGMLFDPSGANVFIQDDDPELVREALPFALKTMETLLAASPENEQLRLATASGFVQFANGFLIPEAEQLEEQDWSGSERLKQRAMRLSLRGRDYALAGLEQKIPDFRRRLHEEPDQALAELSKSEVPFIFWAGAGWGGAIAADLKNMDHVAQLPTVERLMRRGMELDSTFDEGAFHEFFVIYEGGRSEAMGGSVERAREHFDKALALNSGKRISPYLAMASTVAVQEQDYALFKDLMENVLSFDVKTHPDQRLVNVLTQQRAQWLWDRREELFLDTGEEEE